MVKYLYKDKLPLLLSMITWHPKVYCPCDLQGRSGTLGQNHINQIDINENNKTRQVIC